MKKIVAMCALLACAFASMGASAAWAQEPATQESTAQEFAGQAALPAASAAQDAQHADPAGNAVDEDWVTRSLTKGTWEFGALAGGGEGLGKSDNTQFFYAGGRVGVILTRQHFSGWIRGNFEWSADLYPIYVVFPPQSAIYGGSIRPVMWLWNFTSGKKIAPYFGPVGGVLFSTHNVPPGNTSWVNFTPGGVFGAHVFLKKGRALIFEGGIIHHSSASLGTQNPGYNGSFFFQIGYSWFKVRER